MALLYSNNASSTLATNLAIGGTTLSLSAGTGSLFPNPTGGDYFKLTLEDSVGNIEIVHCTARSTDSCTITRAQEGTSERAFSAGASVENRFTAGSIASFNTYAMASNAVANTGTATNVIMNPANTKYFWDQRVTPFATTLLDDTSAADARTTLGVEYTSHRNRLCNGDFRVDNINAGAAVTPAATAYVVDNGRFAINVASKITCQRVASSLTNSAYAMKFTVASTHTPAATGFLLFERSVEGLDMADLMWGTANAQPITISFNVKVSVAGYYSFAVLNGGTDRSYVWQQNIAANTETTVTKTIPGDVTGTWAKGSTNGMRLIFDMGSGSNFATTAETWSAGNYWSTAGCVQLVANAGATYEISGIQIEKGSFATPFEVLPYQQAEAWCRRYHYVLNYTTSQSTGFLALCASTTSATIGITFKSNMRTPPTGLTVTDATKIMLVDYANGTHYASALTFGSASESGAAVALTTTGMTANTVGRINASGVTKLIFTGAEL